LACRFMDVDGEIFTSSSVVTALHVFNERLSDMHG